MRAVPHLRELYHGICVTTEEKARKNLKSHDSYNEERLFLNKPLISSSLKWKESSVKVLSINQMKVNLQRVNITHHYTSSKATNYLFSFLQSVCDLSHPSN